MLTTLDDLKTFLKPLDEKEALVDQEKLSYEEYQEFILENVSLPEFFTLEEADPVYIIEATYTSIVVKNAATGKFVSTANRTVEDLLAAYKMVREDLNGDVKFAGDFSAIEGVKHLGDTQSLSIQQEGKTTSRLLMSHTSRDTEYLAKAHYSGFLRTAEAYLETPDSFLLAWEFINSHPALWYRWDADRDDSWSTDNGVAKLWVQPTLNDEKEIVVMMEAGSAVPPLRTSHYHDLRLDVWGTSYEDSIIQTAALLHKFFNLDGSEKENVDYVKSELELMLEQRMSEIEAD